MNIPMSTLMLALIALALWLIFLFGQNVAG
jgi:hypothetical protein